MKLRKSKPKTVGQDLRSFANYLESDSSSDCERREISEWLNEKLDEWLGQDAFGTEGQLDPRGDHRD